MLTRLKSPHWSHLTRRIGRLPQLHLLIDWKLAVARMVERLLPNLVIRGSNSVHQLG